MPQKPLFISINSAVLFSFCVATLFLFPATVSCRESDDARMSIERVVVGPLKANCYLVYDKRTLDTIIIDPGDEPDKINKVIEMKHLKVRHIVLTHGHFDHVGGVARLKLIAGAPVSIHRKDLALYEKAKAMAANWGFSVNDQPAPDRFLSAADQLSVGKLKFEVIATPGHSPGSISLYGEGVVFTGDTVFAGSVGRTDLPGGDMQELKRSFFRIMDLPLKTRILPGHGGDSTVGQEKKQNFFSPGL